jgi:predicted GNAT family N-acyltransferase
MVQSTRGMPGEAYFATRYSVLRKPLGMPPGSERLADDDQAWHAWIEREGEIVAVGRAHLIPEHSDGSGSDHKGPGAAPIPAFGPLARNEAERPAFQIRQMGTLPLHQRNGFAALVLRELERCMVEECGATTGFLQARKHALPFYLAQGWEVIDEPYAIGGIGPHRSMMKRFST